MTIGTRKRNSSALSAASNVSRKNQNAQRTDKGGLVASLTDVTFTSPDTIQSAGGGLPVVGVGQLIEIVGAPQNSRTYRVVTSTDGTMTVNPQFITTADFTGINVVIRTV